MKRLRRFLSVLALIVLVGSDVLTSFSYALDDMLEDSVVVQTENEEESVDEESSEVMHEDESMEEEELETENPTGDIVEELTGEVSEIDSGEVEELTGFVEELTGTIVENTETEEETVIEEIKYNEEPIIGEKTYNDVTVKVEALSGIFPEGTELKIEPIKSWNLSSLKDKLVEEKEEIKEGTTIVAFDITFKYEGEEVQPKDGEKVKVTFDYSRNEDLVNADRNENQEVKVYHIENKDEEGNEVAPGEEKVVDVTNKQESAENGIAVADADSFSVYVVTYGNEDPEFSATLVGADDDRNNNFHYKTITISDGEHTYTLMDRNLGARVAWNTGAYEFNTISDYDSADDYYGYYYQRGNNYGFTAKTTQVKNPNVSHVLSNAIPSNYVDSSWRIFNLDGYNLRGDTTDTESARQGPCPRGWHVPSIDEWTAIRNAWCVSADKGEMCQNYGQDFAKALQMPTAGYYYYNYGKFTNTTSGSNGYYWSSTSNDNLKANFFFLRSSGTNPNISPYERLYGFPVRCLMNNTDAVTLYLNPNGGRVENAIIDADAQGKVILPTATRNEYVFKGWFTSAGESEKIGDAGDEITINEDTDLYAHWSEIIPNPIVKFNNGADVTEFEVENGGTLTSEQIQQVSNLTHTKATFDGWYTDPEFNQTFDLNTPITADTSLYAKWTCNGGYIQLQGNGGPDMNCFEYGTMSYEDNDGNEHIIMDRNLGATMTGYGVNAEMGSYGYYYQWGNNYGFGPLSSVITSNTQVDCTNINPSTYSSSTFVIGSNDFDWCSSKNDNLWGGSEDGSGNNRGLDTISTTAADRQGPCPDGWHVPSIGERETLLIYGASLNSGTRKTGIRFYNYEMSFSNFIKFTNDFKLPIAGQRAHEGAQLINYGGGGSVNLWSSSPDVDYVWARHFNMNIPMFVASANARSLRGYGMPVRCFKNELKNTLTLNAGGGTVDLGDGAQSIATTGIVKGESFTVPTATRTDHSFDGWFVDANENGKYDDGEVMMGDAGGYIIESMDEDITFTAKWKATITYDGNGGAPDKESDFGQPGDTITLPGANKDGKEFSGWVNSGNNYVGTSGDNYTLSIIERLKALWFDYVVTFVYGNGEKAASPIFVDNGDNITLPSVASISGFTFDGWYDAAVGGNKIGDAGSTIPVNGSRTLYAQGHYNSVELTDDNTTTTVGSGDVVDEVIGFPITMTVIENDILESPEGEELSELEGKELAGDVTIDFGGVDAKFSHLVKVKIPVKGSRKAYVKVKHVSSDNYNYDGLTTNSGASCNDGNIENSDDMYTGAYIDVEDGYVSIYTCEASNFAAFGLPKVTFELENGSGAIVVEVESGAMVSSEDIPTVTKSGYNFSGWYLTGAESAFDFSGTAITGDITLYAKWQEDEGVTYTVSFDANRGTFADTPASQNVLGGEYATDPATFSGYKEPELPGYAFTGWWTEPRGGTQWNFANDTVTGNITLYAHWTYNYDVGDLDVYIVSSTGKISKYVMMDRNVGADEIYNQDFTAQNTGSFGYVYQWGNNRGFNRCRGNGTTCHGAGTPNPDKSTSKVPKLIWQEYYNSKYASGTWIAVGEKVSYLDGFGTDANLWGHETNGYDAKQGPCPDGYYVPTKTEFNEIILEWGSVYKTVKGYNITTANGFRDEPIEYFTHDFLFPLAGAHRKGQLTDSEQGGCAEYWTSVPAGTNNVSNVFFCKNGVNTYYDKSENGKYDSSGTTNNSNGSTVRCFKNTTGTANLNIVMSGGNSAVITVNKFNGVNTIVALTEPKKTDRVFGGWYTSPTFESNTMKTGGDTLSDSVTALYAKWDCPDGLAYNSDNLCVSGVLVRFMDGENEYTRSVILPGEEVSAPTDPEKAGHTFTGWFESGANLPFIFTGTSITGDLDLYAHWDINNYDVNASVATGYEGYLSGMGTTGISLTGLYDYGTELIFIAIPELGYVFDYWMNGDTVLSGTDLGGGTNQLTIVVDQVLNIIAFFKSVDDTPTPYTVEHYQQNLTQTGYDFVWSGIMYGTANAQTNVTGTNYTGFILSGDLASYQTGINADGSTVVRLYYNRGALHTVTFENWNGDFLWSGKVASGETPTYNGSTPSRVSTEQNVYTFDGWYPELSPVTGDITYTAVYTESTRLYTVTLTGTPAGYGTLTPESLSKEYGAAIVISGDKLRVGGTEVTLSGNEGYEFQEWAGTCGKVDKQVCDEHIIYSHSDPIEFTGGNNLIITNPGYDLFSESNYQKDFEISFDIVDQNLSSSVNQATILNVKDEDQENIYPGIAIRKSSSAGKIEITATSNYGKGYKTNKNYSLENLHSIKISRINSILYVSINGSENEQLYDYSGFNAYFTKPIVFGSSYKDEDHLLRPAKITLSNILIKSADNCYTGNVYIVTGDCQMTATFSASDSHEVRIASNNTGYGTVSTESVTKPHGTSIIDNENGTLTIDDVTVTVTTGTAPAGHTYTFSGWIFSSECGSGGNYAVAEGCTITGNFEETLNTYTVTFDLSGGSLTGDMTLTKEYTIETPTISLIGYEPERNGYTFTGWYRDGTLITSMAGGETGDYTLVARWEAQERPIPVVVFMKMLVPGEYTDYDSNLEWGWGTVGELYTAPIEQFTHTGFYYEEDNENNVRSVIVSPNVDNEVHLYFSRIPYPLIITNAGEGISSTTTGGGDHLYEEPVTISVTPYTGWDFVSWSLSQGTLSGVNDLTQRTLSFNMPAEQVMISPILNHIEYTLSFDSASGTAVENQTYYYNDLLSGLDNAITTRTGYDFSGWYLSGVLYTSGSTMPAEDITLTAVWDINEYEVDASVATGGEGYLSGMGSTGISLTGLYDYATELVFIAIPELGYVFDYWKNGDKVLSGTDLGDGTNQLTVVVDQILDIIAFFKPADDTPYTVEHYQANVGLTGYDFVWSGTMYGTTNTQTNATGTDYEGFSLHDGDISAYQTGIKADGSTVVRLYYDRNRYIVTWNTWNGFEVTKTDVAYGQHPHFYLTPPERDILDQEDEDYDFTFTGWTRSGVSGIVDLETEIVTGDITYTAEYDRTLKYYTVKYYPGEGTGIMPDQTNLQLHTSGNLIKNTFTRTGYIFSGRYSSMGLRYEDEQEINMGRADGFEYDLSGNFFLSLEAQWKPSTDTKVTVNYYLKNLNVENNVLTGGSREYLTGVEFTGTTDDIVDILTKYGTGIEGYEYSKSIVYGPDYPSGIETGTTTVLADGSRVIDMYYVPSIYQFILNSESYSSTAGSSESTGYYYGAKVTLSGDINDDCFTWNGWTTSGVILSDNTLHQTWFTMPANDVEVSPSTTENAYNIIFNGNGSNSGTMSPMNGIRCTESTGLAINTFEKSGHTFTGWSTTQGGIREYADGATVYRLSTGADVNLYAIWDINKFNVSVNVATGDHGSLQWSGAGIYEFGETLVIIAVPELGYLFDYWEINGKTELPEGATTGENQLTIVVNQILDIVAHFTANEKTVIINYYEMNTGGVYPNDPYDTDSLTGLVGQTKSINPESRIGFHLDNNRSNTWVTISENSEDNVINIYYERERYIIERSGRYYQMPDGTYIDFINIIPDNQPYYQYYYGEEIRIESVHPAYGWIFSGWYDATSEGKGFPSDEVNLDSRDLTFHMPNHDVWVEPIMYHIPYILSFTGYEGAEITNLESCSYGTGDRETYYDYSECLPYLNKEGYWFNGWDDENGNWVRRLNDYSQYPILNKMPAHDYMLVANFEPINTMPYEKYYYFQDIEGTGYTLSGDLTDLGNNGVTDQEMPGREPLYNIDGFQYSGFGYSGVMLPRDQWPIIKPTGDNYINYYYDRKVYLVNVNYDNKIMSITGAGEYRYKTPVTLTATANTGYSFSGFTSYQGELLSSGSVYNFTMPDSFVDIYADANPIIYSIDYEMNGGHFVPYDWAKTGYTVDGDFDLDIFDAGKEGYTFLGWTGGVIGVRELTEPTTGLIIPLGSTGNRKYFANFEATGSNVTVNYYLKKIDPENNVLTGGVDEYISKGVVYTGLTDSVVDIRSLYGTGIEGYEYTTAIVYGSDLSGGIETGTTTILGDESRSIDIYYTPKKYNFTVIQGQNTTTSGTSISTGYYIGAYITLSGDSKDNCFEWDKWGSSDLPDGKNQQHTNFEMPAHNVTVESIVKEKSYNIIFNANGGTGTMSTLSVQCTTGTLLANNFERDGYTFTGWSRNSNGPVEFIGESDIHRLSTESGGEVTLFAIWNVNWYTVTFDLNGGSLTGNMTLTTGYTIETPAISLENYIPVKTGYNFSGWYKGNDLANSIAGGETGNYTLTAKWEVIPFTVSFDTASGTAVESQIYYYNDALSGLDNAITTKTGYNFSGWYLGDVLYTAVSRMPAKNITLTAKWTPRTGIQYQVNHRGENTGNNNYTTLLSSYKMYGTSNSQTVAESGNFAGFSLSGNVNQKIIKPDGTTVVDIYYNRNVYSIILDNNGGTGVIELTGKYQAPLIVPNPSKSGYEFVGWNPELPTTIPSYDYTGIAMWNPSTGEYKVEFYYQLSDGTYPSMATSGVIRTGMTEGTGSVTAADKNPTMSGYSFDSTNTENVLEGEIVGDGSLILKVYFKKQFTVKYLAGLYGTFPIDIHSDLDYGTGTPIFRENTGSHNPGYTFSGWNPELKEIVTGNMTYEAQWKANLDTLYSVEYYKENLSGGYDIWTGMYTGETDTEVTALIRDFTGFTYSGGNQNNITSGVIAGNGSLVLKLFYNRNKYSITRKDGNNEVLKTDQVFYGAMPIYSGATPTKTRTAQYTYTFNDTWFPNIESVTTGATYTAQFDSTINEYLITFKDGDGKVIQSGMVAYGTTPVYSGATPTKTATTQYTYTFNDTWSPNIELVTTGATYTAQFDSRINSYFATISSNNSDFGTVSPTSVTGMYGANIEISGNVLTISGQNVVASPNVATAQYSYTFSGWINSCGDFISGNCSITAEFNRTVNEYLITFKDGDGNVIQSGMVAYGTTPVYSGATPTKTATAQYTYTFNNTWFPNIESVTTGATYTAEFSSTVNKYTISITQNDTDMGTISTGEINAEYGAAIIESGNKITISGVEIKAIPNPADAQYTYEFDKWTNSCGSELVGTCTIQANFKKVLNKYTITWKDDNGNLIDTTMVEYGKIPTHTKPAKPETEDYRYIFVGWNPELTGVIGDAEYTAVFNTEEKEKPSKGNKNNMSGGGGRGNTSKIEDSDDQNGSGEDNSDGKNFTGEVDNKIGDIDNKIGNVDAETLSLYQWARENNITTMDTLEEANPDGPLTRGHMAKMIVNFAQNVLGKTIPTTYPDKCNWKDKESDRESPEIKEYAKKACALGLMGIYVEEFMPNKILDRAEFGTTISRLLWGNKYNIIDTDYRSYYEDHLRLLKKNGILTQISDAEDRWEIRKWVWLVFRRISEKYKK